MIRRIAYAFCDQENCPIREPLDPQDTQHFRTLTNLGWSSRVEGNEILTYCPTHRPEES